MVNIAPIESSQIDDAKNIISAVAQRIFYPDSTPEEFARILDEEHELDDVDNFASVYDGIHGLFFVAVDNNTRVVGTGAIKALNGETAELKRLWLLEEYHGQGIGYQLVTRLFAFAREVGFSRVYLQTTSQQHRAIDFYHKLGFVEIPTYTDNAYDDVSMAISL